MSNLLLNHLADKKKYEKECKILTYHVTPECIILYVLTWNVGIF